MARNPQNLTPGREPGDGEHWRPSVYLPRELGQAIREATAGMTTQERSRALGRWLLLGYETEQAFETAMESPPLTSSD